MKFFSTLTISLTIVGLGVQATPMPEAEANPLRTLVKRDNLCRVAITTPCRSKAGTKTGHYVGDVGPGVTFAVRCTVKTADEGYVDKLLPSSLTKSLISTRTWDLIPEYNCLVSARDTRSADTAHATCEGKIRTNHFPS